MPDLAPGVTRYPRKSSNQSKRLTPLLWGLGGLFLAAGLAAAVFSGGSLPTTAVLVAAGLLVPPATVLVPGWSRVVVVVALVVGLALVADWQTDTGLGLVGCFTGALVLGVVVLWWLLRRRAWGRRAASGAGAPPSGLDPTGGADVGVLAWWSDEKYDYEAVDPDPSVVLRAVEALDGADRSVVSVYRGRARLDVGGDAGGFLVVQQADDRRRWRSGSQVADPSWRSPGSEAEAGKVRTRTIVFAGDSVEFPEGLLVPLASARAAVHTWLRSGAREPSLTWWTPPGRRREVRRPRLLREQDRPGSTLNTTGDTSYSY